MPKLLAILEKFKEIVLPMLPVIILGGVIVSLSLGKVPFARQLGLDETQKATKTDPGKELRELLSQAQLEGDTLTTPQPTVPLSQSDDCQAGQCQTSSINCCLAWETCGGTSYGWGKEGCSFYQRACDWCGQKPTAALSPTPTVYYAQLTPIPTLMPTSSQPTLTPTITPGPGTPTAMPTSPPVLACLAVGIYNNYADTIPSNSSLLSTGDRVYLTADASFAGLPSQARFKINGGVNTAGIWCQGSNLSVSQDWCVTTNKSGSRFYVPFTIPGKGIFRVEAMVYYQADQQWH